MTNHVLKHDNKPLQFIRAKIDELNRLNQLLKQHLDPEMAKHCHVVKFDKNCLILIVDNGHWTTSLRFQIPDLLSKLRCHPELASLNGICCKTKPPHSSCLQQKKQSRKIARLSSHTANTILQTAAILQDNRLRLILEKIAGYSDNIE